MPGWAKCILANENWQGVDPPHALTAGSAMVPNPTPAADGNAKDDAQPGQAPPMPVPAPTGSPSHPDPAPEAVVGEAVVKSKAEELAPPDTEVAVDPKIDAGVKSVLPAQGEQKHKQSDPGVDDPHAAHDDPGGSSSGSKDHDNSNAGMFVAPAAQKPSDPAVAASDPSKSSKDPSHNEKQAVPSAAGVDAPSQGNNANLGESTEKAQGKASSEAQESKANFQPPQNEPQKAKSSDGGISSSAEIPQDNENKTPPSDNGASKSKAPSGSSDAAAPQNPPLAGQDRLAPSEDGTPNNKVLPSQNSHSPASENSQGQGSPEKIFQAPATVVNDPTVQKVSQTSKVPSNDTPISGEDGENGKSAGQSPAGSNTGQDHVFNPLPPSAEDSDPPIKPASKGPKSETAETGAGIHPGDGRPESAAGNSPKGGALSPNQNDRNRFSGGDKALGNPDKNQQASSDPSSRTSKPSGQKSGITPPDSDPADGSKYSNTDTGRQGAGTGNANERPGKHTGSHNTATGNEPNEGNVGVSADDAAGHSFFKPPTSNAGQHGSGSGNDHPNKDEAGSHNPNTDSDGGDDETSGSDNDAVVDDSHSPDRDVPASKIPLPESPTSNANANGEGAAGNAAGQTPSTLLPSIFTTVQPNATGSVSGKSVGGANASSSIIGYQSGASPRFESGYPARPMTAFAMALISVYMVI